MLPYSASFASRLQQQIGLLIDLNGLYDRGSTIHALSIAGRISVIVEMMKSSEGGEHIRKFAITFPTPIDPTATAAGAVSPLVSKQVYVDDRMVIVSQINLPAFADPNRPTPFRCRLSKWLKQPAFHVAPGEFISRRRLIDIVRNKDGGGHAHSELPPEYVSFSQDAGMMSLRVSQPGAPEPTPPIHFATIRHMAQELSEALSPSLAQAREM